MRYRMLFGLPLVCAALAVALSFFAAPSPQFDHRIVVTAERMPAADIFLPVLTVEHHAFVAADETGDAPFDAHKAVYLRANQPGASWRIAAESTFVIIDPHISIA